jgi:hypothetical protein
MEVWNSYNSFGLSELHYDVHYRRIPKNSFISAIFLTGRKITVLVATGMFENMRSQDPTDRLQ